MGNYITFGANVKGEQNFYRRRRAKNKKDRPQTVFLWDSLVLDLLGCRIEDGGDLLGGLAVQKRYHDRYDHAYGKAGDELVNACRAGKEGQPQHVNQRAADNTSQCTLIGKSAPEEREDNDRTEGRAKACPSVFHEVHDRLRAVSLAACDEVSHNSNDKHNTASDPQGLLIRRVLTDQGLVDVRGEGGGGYEKLAVCRRHRRGDDGGEKESRNERGEQHSRELNEYHTLLTGKKKLLTDEHSSEVSDHNDGSQRKHHPGDCHNGRFFNHRGLLDRHKANQNVGHTEVAETPSKTVGDLRGRSGEHVGHEIVRRAVELHRVGKECRVQILGKYNKDRDGKNRYQHQKSLEEVRPADGLVSTKEGIHDQDGGKDKHSRSLFNVEDRGEYVCTGHKGRGYVHREANEENDRADHLERFALGDKAIGKVLGKRDGVAGRLREAAESACNEDPVECRTDGKADADPRLSETERQNASGKTHQQPCAHIGRLCAHCGDPRAHRSAAQEIVLVGFALGAEEEKHAYGKHCRKIKNEC